MLLFYLELELVCTKNYRFVEYTFVKFFKNILQSAVNTRRQRDENTISSLVADTLKLLANISYGYQVMDRSRHSITKKTKDGKTHAAINPKISKRFGYFNDQLYEVDLAKSEIERKEQIIVGFFKRQYAKLRILELYYLFHQNFVILTSMRRWKSVPILCF